MKDDLKDGRQKMTSKYEKQNISANTVRILLKFETEAYGNKPKCPKASNEDDIQWKMTSNGR